MSQPPVISAVLTVPGPAPGRVAALPDYAFSIGLVLDEARVFWVSCRPPDGDAIRTVKQTVAPALSGQPLTALREMATRIDGLTEEVTVVRTLPKPEPAQESPKLSRRQLLTGRFVPDPPKNGPPLTEEITVEQPLHPTIRLAVSQLLLAALAGVNNQVMAEVIQNEYDLPDLSEAAATYAEVDPTADGWETGLIRWFDRRVDAVGFRYPGQDPESELGMNGQVMVRHVRRFQELLLEQARPDYRPALHLNVRGGLGRQADDSVGKVLGALFALKQDAAQLTLRLEDPFQVEERDDQIAKMRQLKDYLRFRKIKLALVAGRAVQTPDDVTAFGEAEAADILRLDMTRLGGLATTVEAIQSCHEASLQLLLDAGSAGHETARYAAHLALAARPDLVTAPAGRDPDAGVPSLQVEMARTLAWLEARN